MKIRPRCDHADGVRQCPDSAGYRLLKPNGVDLRPGRFCLRHATPKRDRVPTDRLPAEDR